MLIYLFISFGSILIFCWEIMKKFDIKNSLRLYHPDYTTIVDQYDYEKKKALNCIHSVIKKVLNWTWWLLQKPCISRGAVVRPHHTTDTLMDGQVERLYQAVSAQYWALSSVNALICPRCSPHSDKKGGDRLQALNGMKNTEKQLLWIVTRLNFVTRNKEKAWGARVIGKEYWTWGPAT